MVDLDKNILLIQINVNGLNTAIKRQRSQKKMIRFLQLKKKPLNIRTQKDEK